MPFGLRWGSIVLMQIAGGGRIRLACEGRDWWSKHAPLGRPEVFETEHGHYYPTRAEAEEVAAAFEQIK
jgi:hypothetical protein